MSEIPEIDIQENIPLNPRKLKSKWTLDFEAEFGWLRDAPKTRPEPMEYTGEKCMCGQHRVAATEEERLHERQTSAYDFYQHIEAEAGQIKEKIEEKILTSLNDLKGY